MSASTIVVAIDFSEMSRFALDYATTHAKKTGARVLIVHVLAVPSGEQGEGMLHSGVDQETPQTAERRLKAIKSTEEDVQFEHRLVRGEPAKEILRVAQEENAEFIVLGTHGRTGLMRVLMGSVAEQVVRDATCPVMTVKIPKALS